MNPYTWSMHRYTHIVVCVYVHAYQHASQTHTHTCICMCAQRSAYALCVCVCVCCTCVSAFVFFIIKNLATHFIYYILKIQGTGNKFSVDIRFCCAENRLHSFDACEVWKWKQAHSARHLIQKTMGTRTSFQTPYVISVRKIGSIRLAVAACTDLVCGSDISMYCDELTWWLGISSTLIFYLFQFHGILDESVENHACWYSILECNEGWIWVHRTRIFVMQWYRWIHKVWATSLERSA